jgi:hypothetical protein
MSEMYCIMSDNVSTTDEIICLRMCPVLGFDNKEEWVEVLQCFFLQNLYLLADQLTLKN